MISVLRGLRMASESTGGRYWTVIFLASVDLVCLFEAGDLFKEGHIKSGVAWLFAAVLFSIIGYNWPRLWQWSKAKADIEFVSGVHPFVQLNGTNQLLYRVAVRSRD